MVMNTMDLFCMYEQSLILKRKIFLSILKLSNGNGNIQKISTKDYWNLEYTLAHPPRLALGRRPGLLHPVLPTANSHSPCSSGQYRSVGLWMLWNSQPLFFAKHVLSDLLLENVKLHNVAFKPKQNLTSYYLIIKTYYDF